MCIIQIDSCIRLNIVLNEVNNSKSHVVLYLEESENELFHMIFGREFEASITRIVHVDWADSW